MPSKRPSFRVGSRFEHLRIRRRLGEGAYGRVYLAFDENVRREVALKVLPMPLARRGERAKHDEFLREARVLGRLPHANIPVLYAVHELEGGGLALEMEHVEGPTAEALVEGHRALDPVRVRALARGVARALAAAHASGVVHGDVKLQNVIVQGSDVAKLVDFGLARLAGAAVEAPAGTLAYMAPELLEGAAPTPQADVWSFGVLLVRLLTGRLPFEAPLGALDADAEVGEQATQGLPRDLADLIAACLSRRLDRRPANGSQLVEWLEGRSGSKGDGRSSSVIGPDVPAAVREGELARIQQALPATAGPEGCVVVVTGPVGTGKSTLLSRVREAVGATGRRWVGVQVSPLEGLVGPLIAALTRALRRPPRGARGASSRSSTGVEAPTLSALAEIDGLSRALAEAEGLLIALEDVHLATPEEVRLLQRVVRRTGGSRVAWLVTERTADLTEGGAGGLKVAPLLSLQGASHVPLLPLEDQALYLVLQRRFAQADLDGALAEPVVRRAQGNPLFAVQLFQHLVEQGGARVVSGRWTPAPEADLASLPPALRDVVARRIDTLAVSERELLELAALDRPLFDVPTLAGMLALRPADVRRALEQLARRRALVERRGDAYAFAHPLVMEVLGAALTAEVRRELHRRWAERLESAERREDAERVGLHWERADEPLRASPHLLLAAQRAAERREGQRCVELARRAGVPTLLEDDELVRGNARALIWVASCLSAASESPLRGRIFARLRHVATRGDSALLAAELDVHEALQRLVASGPAPGDEAAVRAAEASLPDGPARLRARFVLLLLEKHRGNLAAASAWIDAAEPLARQVGDAAFAGTLRDQRAALSTRLGHVEQARREYLEAEQLCRQGGQDVNAEISAINGCLLDVAAGRLEASASRMEVARRALRLDGEERQAAAVLAHWAEVQYALGNTSTALTAAREACRVLDATQYALGQVLSSRTLATLLFVRGEESELRERMALLRQLVGRLDDLRGAAHLAALEAQWRAVIGEAEEAARLASEALLLGQRSGEPRTILALSLNLSAATYVGLPRHVVTEALASAERVAGTAEPFAAEGLVVLRALAAPTTQGHDAAREQAVATLEATAWGARRAELRLLAPALTADMSHACGDLTRLASALEAGWQAATNLGHRWWSQAFARRAANVLGGPLWTARAQTDG